MKKSLEEDIPLSEDLMREHGILNRVLLIYEELIRRMEAGESPLVLLGKAASIIKEFIENHHERMEEQYIFPLFEKHKKKVTLVKTLRTQHVRGREITDALLRIADQKTLDTKTRKTVITLLKKFITMYRPHEAREDTELFPMVRSFLTEKEFEELGELFEKLEHTMFGDDGFMVILKRVETIEKELGIYQLDQFTPSLE